MSASSRLAEAPNESVDVEQQVALLDAAVGAAYRCRVRFLVGIIACIVGVSLIAYRRQFVALNTRFQKSAFGIDVTRWSRPWIDEWVALIVGSAFIAFGIAWFVAG
ncbi:MAG: hypothetical protein V7636_2493 [Actinomycetota bacterium]|jgi:hypothetical protein